MSFLRVVFILFLAFIVFFIPQPLIRLPVLAILLILAGSGVVLHLSLRSLSMDREAPTVWGEPGTGIPIRVTVRNGGVFPLWSLTVIDQASSLTLRSTPKCVVDLSGFSEKTLEYTVASNVRGEYALGPVVVRGTDIFGIFSFYRKLELPGRVVVYPELFPARVTSANGLPAGSLASYSHVYDDVTKTHSLREYMAGDDVRYIHWKVSASKGKLYTREFIPSLYFQVVIILNSFIEDYPVKLRSFLFERAVSAAASIASIMGRQGIDVGFLTHSADGLAEKEILIPMAGGMAHTIRLLEEMACLKPLHKKGFHPGLRLGQGMQSSALKYFYVGPMPSPEVLQEIMCITTLKNRFEFFFLDTEDVIATVVDSRFHRIKPYGKELIG